MFFRYLSSIKIAENLTNELNEVFKIENVEENKEGGVLENINENKSDANIEG